MPDTTRTSGLPRRSAMPYREACEMWALNDDTSCLDDGSSLTVAATMIAWIYGRNEDEHRAELSRAVKRMGRFLRKASAA